MGWVNSGRVLSPRSWECLPLWFGQSSAFTGAFLAVLGHCCVLSFNSVCAPGREFRHGKGIPSGMRSFSSPTASLAPLSHSVVLRNEQMRAVHLHPPIHPSVCLPMQPVCSREKLEPLIHPSNGSHPLPWAEMSLRSPAQSAGRAEQRPGTGIKLPAAFLFVFCKAFSVAPCWLTLLC